MRPLTLPIEAEGGNGLPRLCQTVSPDVLLMAVASNSLSNLHVLVNVLAIVPTVRILIIGATESPPCVRAVLASGILGYILKAADAIRTFPGYQTSVPGTKIYRPSTRQLPVRSFDQSNQCPK